MLKRLAAALAVVWMSACGANLPPVVLPPITITLPQPPVVPSPVVVPEPALVPVTLQVQTVEGQPIAGAAVRINTHQNLADDHLAHTEANGGLSLLLEDPTGDGSIFVTAEGFQPYDSNTVHLAQLAHPTVIVLAANPPPAPPLPPPPTRDQALNICLSFQGLTVHTQQYGNLPWFESALTWLDLPEDRQAVYAAKHASRNAFCPNGDTHALIHAPVGDPLYDEPGQPYSGDRFGARDWTNHLTKMDPKFIALVQEVRQAGFIPLVFACGDGSDPSNYACAMTETPLLLDALEHGGVRDLRRDVVFVPGYDGVFYGWGQNAEETRREIISWPTLIRANCPLCYIGIEHSTGHIPLGEGDSDWVGSGTMRIFDLLLSEFDDDRFDDSVWQIAGRTIGPAYRRPADQPADDDPRPPFYLREDTPRGRFYACAFEFGTYGWVRSQYDAAHVATVQRAYFVARGYSCGG